LFVVASPNNSFYDAQDVFLDHSVPNEVRYLAIIQLKNGIDKYWRKTAPKYVIGILPRRGEGMLTLRKCDQTGRKRTHQDTRPCGRNR
jgi:hypothetical protein